MAATTTLLKVGSATLMLTGSNTFSGGVTVLAGGLAITNPASLGSGTVSVGPATLEVAGNFRMRGVST